MGDDSKPDKTSVLIKFRWGNSEDLPLLFSPASPERKNFNLCSVDLNFEIHRISQVNEPLFAACRSTAFLLGAGTCFYNIYRIPFSVPLRLHIMSRSHPIINPVAYLRPPTIGFFFPCEKDSHLIAFLLFSITQYLVPSICRESLSTCKLTSTTT